MANGVALDAKKEIWQHNEAQEQRSPRQGTTNGVDKELEDRPWSGRGSAACPEAQPPCTHRLRYNREPEPGSAQTQAAEGPARSQRGSKERVGIPQVAACSSRFSSQWFESSRCTGRQTEEDSSEVSPSQPHTAAAQARIKAHNRAASSYSRLTQQQPLQPRHTSRSQTPTPAQDGLTGLMWSKMSAARSDCPHHIAATIAWNRPCAVGTTQTQAQEPSRNEQPRSRL